MNINERLLLIINELYNGNKRAFSLALGLTPTVIENVVGKRKGKPSFDVLEKICAIANISGNWLLTGEGPMLRSDTAVTEPSNAVSTSDQLDESGTITALRSIIKEQAREIARLEIELDRYRTSSTVGESPLNGQD